MKSFVDWFIPPELRSAPPDELRRMRLTVVFCIGMGLNSLPNLFVLLHGGVLSVATSVGVLIAAYGTVPFLLRATGSLRLAAHLLVAAGGAGLLTSSAYSGGLSSPGLVWWGATLIFAVMLLGTRVGLFWTAIAVGSCIVYIALHKNGIAVRNDIAHLDSHEALGSSYATAFIAFFLLVRVYENLKGSMLHEIGLAKESVERAHQSARMVLDNVGQGLLVADESGTVGAECSEALTRWFGPVPHGESLFAYFEKINHAFADWLEVSWSSVFEDALPVDVCIAQMPSRFVHSDRHYAVTYRPILRSTVARDTTSSQTSTGSPVSAILVMVTDITELVTAERAEEEQRELLAILQRAMSERAVLLDFLDESRSRVQLLCDSPLEPTVERRELHTLKGNAGLFGLIRTPRLCHELEEKLANEDRGLTAEERISLRDHWTRVEARVMPLVGDTSASIQLSMSEYHGVLETVAQEQPHSELYAQMRSWAHEPTHKRLTVFAEQIEVLARRLGKGDITVRLDDGGVRLPRLGLRDFWSSFAHVVRNAIDHGVESPEERAAHGKPLSPQIELATRIEHGEAIVEIADDGRGIDWLVVAEAARARGLPTQTKEQLEAALFADGLTTRSEATDISGRGVGLAAVLAAVRNLGGRITIDSKQGQGTRFSFRFALTQLRPSVACPPMVSEVPTEAVRPARLGEGFPRLSQPMAVNTPSFLGAKNGRA